MKRGLLAALVAAPLAFGCAQSQTPDAKTGADSKEVAQKPPENAPPPASADRSRCDKSGKKTVELDLNRDGRADVWKFFAAQMDSGTRIDVLTCKEVDLNFDNHLDMWVYYDNTGDVALEEFDLDFDGRVDLSTYRAQGRLSRQELDTNFDGKPDIWKFFENEKLARIERSSNHDGRIDVWEYYEGGKLDRIGYDTTGSGKVDRWDRAAEEEGVPPSQQQSKTPAVPMPPSQGPSTDPSKPAPAEAAAPGTSPAK